VVNPNSRTLLKARSIPVWLQADVGVLAKRCSTSDARPLLKTGDPATILSGLLDKRASLYAETAAFTVVTDIHSANETVDKIIEGLNLCL
jgi:shikimate kinase